MKKVIFFILFIMFSNIIVATNLSFSEIIPDHIPHEKVMCIDLVSQDDASAIYKIETIDGDVLYQVVSIVVMKVLPTGIELACNYLVKSPSFCKYVKYAGEALIGIYKDDVKKMVKRWTTKKVGGIGVAKVYSKDYSGAEDAHRAFKLSKTKENFPWGAPVVEQYRDMNFAH